MSTVRRPRLPLRPNPPPLVEGRSREEANALLLYAIHSTLAGRQASNLLRLRLTRPVGRR